MLRILAIVAFLILPLSALADAGVAFSGSGRGSAASGGGGGGVAEARCAELGSSCLMSEPLNTATYNCVSNVVDFADSEGAGAKEATAGLASASATACGKNDPVASSVSDVDLPTGTSTISYVMKAGLKEVKMIDNTFSGVSGLKRYCMRHYRKFSSSPAFATFQTCGGDKGLEIWSSSSTLFQYNEHGDPAHLFSSDLGAWSSGDAANHDTTPPDIFLTDCTDNWCRIELCLSTTDADIRNLTNVTVTAYAAQVGVASPKSASTTPRFIGSSSFGGMNGNWPYVTYRHDFGNNETCASEDAAEWGYSYYTHVMTAGWTTDSGQTIGAACEVEGGC